MDSHSLQPLKYIFVQKKNKIVVTVIRYLHQEFIPGELITFSMPGIYSINIDRIVELFL